MYQHMIAVRDRSRSTGPGRAIMYALASRANANGEAWPSLPKLAKDAGVTKRTVEKNIRKLEALDEIAVDRAAQGKWTNGGTQLVNVYRICLSTGSDGETPPSGDGSGNGYANGSGNTPETDTQGSERGSPKVASDVRKGSERRSPKVNLEGYPLKQTLKDKESHVRSDVRDPVFFFLVFRATCIAGDRSQKQKAYLTTVLSNWVKLDGKDDAYARFQKCLDTVLRQRDLGRITGSVSAYLGESLRQARESWDAGYENRQHYLANEGVEPKYTGALS
jgi:hypothetical protein